MSTLLCRTGIREQQHRGGSRRLYPQQDKKTLICTYKGKNVVTLRVLVKIHCSWGKRKGVKKLQHWEER